MRFMVGAIPENPDFHPEEEGWRGLREPDPMRMQFLALGPMIVAAALVLLTLHFATGVSLKTALKWFLPAFLLMIPIHELMHAFASPAFGTTDKTLVGVWPSHALFYAHYEGELSRERFLAILAAPTFVLTILPLVLLTLSPLDSAFLAAIAFANAVGAAGDMLGMGIVLRQIPRGAIVRNNGWKTYWRPSAGSTV